MARPGKALKGVRRVTLQPGETRTVEIPLAWEALAYWSPDRGAFVIETGTLGVDVGASSGDTRLSGALSVQGERV